MIIKVLFPQERGRFVEKRYEVPVEVVRDMFNTYRETRNLSRAIDVVCGYIVEVAAEEWCKRMSMRSDECVTGYIDKQGERIREQCELAVRAWLFNVYECVRQGRLDVECVNESTRG